MPSPFPGGFREDYGPAPARQHVREDTPDHACYRALIEAAPVPLAVLVEGCLAYVNPAARTLFGAGSQEDVLGRPMTDLASPAAGERVTAWAYPRPALATTAEQPPLFERLIRLDQQPVDIEISTTPVTWIGQSAVLAVLREVTQQNQAESDLADALTREQFARQHAERARAEAEAARARITRILESITDAFFALDQQGHFTYVNARAERLLRHTREDLLGSDIRDTFPGLQDTVFEHEIRQAMLSGTPAAFVGYYPPTSDWFEVHAYAAADGLAVYFRDVTRRVQAEQELREREERFRLVARATNDAVWDWDLMTNALWWGEGIRTLFGHDLTGASGDIHSWTGYIHVEDRDRVLASIEAAIAGGAELWTEQYRFMRADGSIAHVFDRGFIVRDASGTPLRMVGAVTDLSQQRQHEEALRTSEDRLRRQFKGVPIPTYTWRWSPEAGDLVLEAFNDAAEVVTGGSVAGVVGVTAGRHHADHSVVLEGLRACLEEQRTLHRAVRYCYGPGMPERDLAVTFVPVPPDAVMVFTEDVTDRKQAEAQQAYLARTEKLRVLGQLASGVAHDLNQTLALAAGYAELARRAADDGDVAGLHEALETVHQAALDGGETVGRLLAFGRTRPGSPAERVDVEQLLVTVAHLTAPRWRDATRAEGRPVSLRVDVAGEIVVDGWSQALREALTNLVFNAVDALPEGGEIVLAAYPKDGEAAVEVRDNGVGLDAESQAHVFEPFFSTKGEKGTGLGLAQVYGIVVQQHRGSVRLDSAPGRGTSVQLLLPLARMPAAGAAAPAESAAQRPPRSALRILAVDDEPPIARMVALLLDRFGHHVVTAGSVDEALARLREEPFDAVVSDLGLGEGPDGWDLAAAVRSTWPKIRFVLATGWGADIKAEDARARGVDVVIAKPYQSDDLARAVSPPA